MGGYTRSLNSTNSRGEREEATLGLLVDIDGNPVSAGGGGGDGNPSTADTGLTPYDTLPEAIATDPTANTAGTATVAYRMTGLLRWLIKLVQPIVGAIDSAGTNSAALVTIIRDTGYALPSKAISVIAAIPQPTAIATPINGVAITAVTAQTDLGVVQVDLNALNHQGIFNLAVEIATNTTAPGASRTLTLFYAFSQNSISTGIVATQLSTRETSLICNLANSTSTTREYETGRVDQMARYLYVWYDHSARDASSQLTLTVRVNAL